MKKFTLITYFFSSLLFAQNCQEHPVFRKLIDLKNKCQEKKVHLTFDDGPDEINTPKIINELNAKGVKASFFVSTEHLKPGEKNLTLLKMIESGHIVASHGHQHKSHDLRLIKTSNGYICDSGMLTPEQSEQEIKLSQKLLSQATLGKYDEQKYHLLRFPYGRGASPSPIELGAIKNSSDLSSICSQNLNQLDPCENYSEELKKYRTQTSEPLKRLHATGSDHVGWNFDSQDSSIEVMTKAKNDPNWYIEKTLRGFCENPQNSIMSLFHDYNKPFNADNIGKIIELGKCLGINFVSYEKLLEQKEFLTDVGVLQEAPKLNKQLVQNAINNFATIDPTNAILTSCQENSQQTPDYSCHSSNGQTYQHCQGESSICFKGKWISSNDERVAIFCSQKTCSSDYSSKKFTQCQGEDSICINGQWLSKSDPLVAEVCY